jgi:hypothetical protein
MNIAEHSATGGRVAKRLQSGRELMTPLDLLDRLVALLPPEPTAATATLSCSHERPLTRSFRSDTEWRELAYAVEKLDSRFLRGDFGGLKPSPDQFARLWARSRGSTFSTTLDAAAAREFFNSIGGEFNRSLQHRP